jgi:HAD superfamily hydrolase (TIGR01459 family)
MTNSGKRSEANRRRLAAMGLALEPSQVVSSGEVAYQDIKTGRLGRPFARGGKAFILGKCCDEYGFEGLDLEFVCKPRDADFLLILGTNVPEWSVDSYRELLDGAAGQGIPALCCNPDLEMLTPSGIHPAPGAIARLYEELGGEVSYIGKPERAIYAHAMAVAGSPRPSRTLAIGDSISHDVVGAHGVGIAVALVLTGLSQGMTDAEIADRAERSKAAPDWVLPTLHW